MTEVTEHREDSQAVERADTVDDLPGIWHDQADEYPDTPKGQAGEAAVRLCAEELDAMLENERGGEDVIELTEWGLYRFHTDVSGVLGRIEGVLQILDEDVYPELTEERMQDVLERMHDDLTRATDEMEEIAGWNDD